MPKDLVPIKVKIGLRPNGHADHPNWTLLPMIGSDNEVRQHCPSSWIYDKSCGHKEERIEGNQWDSPYGMQWGCFLCTRQFVDQALTALPDLVAELTAVEFEDFFDNYSRVHMPENNYDTETLTALQVELDMKQKLNANTTALEAKITKALDPDDPEPGIKKNFNKKWSDYKANKGFNIK